MKAMRKAIGTAAIAAMLWAAGAALTQDRDERIREAIGAVSESELTDDALALTGHLPVADEWIESRHVRHPDHAVAMAYLEDRLDEIGVAVVEEPFDCSGDCANLVVELPGSLTPERIWLVGAHFDSTNGVDPQAPAEGAVDNASGVVVALQALSALSAYETADTLRFVFFDAEEIGLVGSAHHAGAARDRGDEIACMLNFDVPGWRSGGIDAAFANSNADSWPVLERMIHVPERYDVGTNLIGVPTDLIDTADMASFWDEGYCGLMVGSLYELTGWMNTAQDTYDKLDTEQCANVARLLVAFLSEEAGLIGPRPPDDAGDDDDSSDDDDDADDDAAGDENGGGDDENDDDACG